MQQIEGERWLGNEGETKDWRMEAGQGVSGTRPASQPEAAARKVGADRPAGAKLTRVIDGEKKTEPPPPCERTPPWLHCPLQHLPGRLPVPRRRLPATLLSGPV